MKNLYGFKAIITLGFAFCLIAHEAQAMFSTKEQRGTGGAEWKNLSQETRDLEKAVMKFDETNLFMRHVDCGRNIDVLKTLRLPKSKEDFLQLLNPKDKHGQTVIMRCATYGNRHMLSFILKEVQKRGVLDEVLFEKNKDGKPALMLLVESCNFFIVYELVESNPTMKSFFDTRKSDIDKLKSIKPMVTLA